MKTASSLQFVTDAVVQTMVRDILRGEPESSNTTGADGAAWFAGNGVALHHGDSLALLPRFAPESFDMVFADPPYFLSGAGITCSNGKMVPVKKGAWDEPLATLAAMHEFNRTWLALCQTLLKPNGTLFVTGTHHNIYSVGFALAELGYKIVNDIAWYKINPPPNLSCRYFTHATETILWAKKNDAARHYYDYPAMKAANGNKQMLSLWNIAPPKPWEKRHGKHPTQKPEALLDRIVRAATRPGDVVLDPFCGSGTTGVVCARLGRGFVGIEQEAEYLEKAAARIREELAGVAPFRLAHRIRERRIRYKTKPTVIIDQE